MIANRRRGPTGGNAVQLRSMSIDKLSKLRSQVEKTLAAKVAETRRMLESQLAKLTGVGTGSARGRRGGARGKVAPKYRNPENHNETWAGRGFRPRWLTAALKGGKKLEHFSITAVGKKAAKKARKIKANLSARHA
jgi:DNA-binding protein H-NS